MSMIDITGNWRNKSHPSKGIHVSEPVPVLPGNPFIQTLELPPGMYTLHFAYDPSRDYFPGLSLFNRYEGFSLTINKEAYILGFSKALENETEVFRATCDFRVRDKNARETVIEMQLMNNRPFDTYISLNNEVPSSYAALPVGEGAKVHLIRGIPFLSKREEKPPRQWEIFDYIRYKKLWGGFCDGPINIGGASVGKAHFLGMIHMFDIANGSWYSHKGDHGFSHFVGDTAGYIRVRFGDGTTTDIPLVFGFNLWYGLPWDVLWSQRNYAPEGEDQRVCDESFFGGNNAYREIIQHCVGVDDAILRMDMHTHNQRYMFTVDLEGRKVESIEILGTEDMYGMPLVSACTLEISGEPPKELSPLPHIASPQDENITVHRLSDMEKPGYKPMTDNIEQIRHILYTYLTERPHLKVPEKPPGYFGPDYDFAGDEYAVLAATYLYYNSVGCAAFIGDRGTGCSGPFARWRTTVYATGLGVWMATRPIFDGPADFLKKYQQENHLPNHGQMWTRGAGQLIRETMAFGYTKFIDAYIDWLDNALLTEANPPHWNRIAGLPEFDTTSHQVGDIIEKGNRENDGHGICMWGRYMVWHWKNRDIDWNRRHFAATKAACDWIQWQLDNDELRPGRRVDILYTESECAHGDYDFFSSFNCLHGLKLSIRMAEQLNETEAVEKYTQIYNRLAEGILTHLQDESKHGLIWHTEERTDWQDHAHKLAHIHLATEGDTYTPLEDYTEGYDAKYLETDLRSYKYVMAQSDNPYDCLRMYGYGQGMMTQAALLLDQIADAEAFIKLMVTHNYLPHMEKWLSPEGIITHKSGEFYVAVNGYMGQDSHVADSTKAVRIMLGIDDNKIGNLRIVPRFPASWTTCAISDYPVLLTGGRGTISYKQTRSETALIFDFEFSKAPSNFDVRLGPFLLGATIKGATINGIPHTADVIQSGDSIWAWVRGLSCTSGCIRVEC